MANNKLLNFLVSQPGVDTDKVATLGTTLNDSTDEVMRILAIECEFIPSEVVSWPPIVDTALRLVIANEITGVYYIGASKTVVTSFGKGFKGTALAATDCAIDSFLMRWEPPADFPVYLYNETFVAYLASQNTGITNDVSLRLYLDKVKIGATQKLALKSL